MSSWGQWLIPIGIGVNALVQNGHERYLDTLPQRDRDVLGILLRRDRLIALAAMLSIFPIELGRAQLGMTSTPYRVAPALLGLAITVYLFVARWRVYRMYELGWDNRTEGANERAAALRRRAVLAFVAGLTMWTFIVGYRLF
jgi:hypothetical protein